MIHQILIIAFITVIKSIFTAADTAITYLNKAEINQLAKKNKKAKKIKMLMDESNKFFGVIEVGTNLAELVASSYASITILNTFTFAIQKTGIEYNYAMFIAAFIITIILSYILLLFGGVIPKRYARNNPRKTAFALVDIIWVLTFINKPFDKIINASLNFFSKIFKLSQWQQEKLTDKQIKMIISEGKDEGVINGVEKRILINALKLDDIPVKRIIIPNEKVDYINIKSDFKEILKNIEKYKFTRMPVYENEKSNIIGFLNIKDLIMEYARDKTINEDIRPILRPVKYISSETNILNAFKELQKEKRMLAMVKNKKNEILGVVTLEDILEKIVGKISDEYDEFREN